MSVEMHETPGFPGFEHAAGTEPGICVACDPAKHTGPHKAPNGEYVRCSGCEPERDLESAVRAAHAALGSFIWLGNNLHNSDTDTFREMYMACLEDAVTAFNATAEEGERPRSIADTITVWRKSGAKSRSLS